MTLLDISAWPTRPAAAAQAQRCALVIFGATGDLTRRKLIPALHNMHMKGRLPEHFAVLGCGRRKLALDDFRDQMREACKQYCYKQADADEWARFARRLYYEAGDFTEPDLYQRLNLTLNHIDSAFETQGNRLFYLATLPSGYPVIVDHLGKSGLVNRESDTPFTRIMVEKPFGRDYDSAVFLNQELQKVFREDQTYRIDHYLGKETVQNILVFRFANAIFEPLWNRRHIDHMQITASETIGVEGRGDYYEESGVLRDMVQNHLLQTLSLVTMEPPLSFAADDIRDRNAEVFKALRRMTSADEIEHNTVRGQYGRDASGTIAAYREEPHVRPDSVTPTYVALKLFIDNWRWQGVPFYIRTGKRLKRYCTEVVIQFNQIPFCLFGQEQVCSNIGPNQLVIRIQPHEGIDLGFNIKEPGAETNVDNVHMEFSYHRLYEGDLLDAYERLLMDAMRGYAGLFARRDSVEEAWRFITPILEVWKRHPPHDFPNYEAGSEGPARADEWIRRDGRQWYGLDRRSRTRQ